MTDEAYSSYRAEQRFAERMASPEAAAEWSRLAAEFPPRAEPVDLSDRGLPGARRMARSPDSVERRFQTLLGLFGPSEIAPSDAEDDEGRAFLRRGRLEKRRRAMATGEETVADFAARHAAKYPALIRIVGDELATRRRHESPIAGRH